jgi:two-component system LytT family response regulator
MSWFPQIEPSLDEIQAPYRNPTRAIIADEEAAARARLGILLASEADVEVVAECQSGAETVAAVRSLKTGLLLLSIPLPDCDGFEVLRNISPEDMPMVILTSPHGRHAMRAFEARALDFLVKPLDERRLHAAIERVRMERANVRDRILTYQLLRLLADSQRQPVSDSRLAVKVEGRVVLLELDQIDWIQADGNYVCIKAGAESYMPREAIGRIQGRLDPKRFVRIHRSIIVNARRIRELQPCNSGEYMVVLKDGKELSCSRGYRASLRQLLAA